MAVVRAGTITAVSDGVDGALIAIALTGGAVYGWTRDMASGRHARKIDIRRRRARRLL